MNTPILSICIPTYNRANYLDECLNSLCLTSPSVLQEVEVIISDNASPDATAQTVEKYKARLPIRYFRNSENIGGERNFMAAAQRASSRYVWVFGDDDLFEPEAIESAIKHIKQGFDLIVLNYSLWSLDMATKNQSAALPFKKTMIFDGPNSSLATLGCILGYISCVVVKKDIYTNATPEEYGPFIQYGFSHLYSTYAGLPTDCRAVCLPSPVFKNREGNSPIFVGSDGYYNWTKYFIYGTALVFDALEQRGYTKAAVVSAKGQVLRDFAYKTILGGLPGVDRRIVLAQMMRLYRWNWRFWVICLPGLLVPRMILRLSRNSFLTARDWARRVRHSWPMRRAG